MKYTRCERVLLVKAFFCFFFIFVVYSSLENYQEKSETMVMPNSGV